MKFKHLLALCLIAVLTVGCLSACAPSTDELLAKADAALADTPYRMTVDMTFTGDENDVLVTTLTAMMNNLDISLDVDGEDVHMSMGMSVSAGGSTATVDMEMTAIADRMYIMMEQSSGGQTDTTKVTGAVTDEQRDEIIGQNGAATTDISVADFETVTMEKEKGVYVITCTDLKEEAADKLNDAFAVVGADSQSVSADNVCLVIEVKDGKYQKATITCDYSVDFGGDAPVELAATIVMAYTYGDVTVTAPADASDYDEVDLGDMFG